MPLLYARNASLCSPYVPIYRRCRIYKDPPNLPIKNLGPYATSNHLRFVFLLLQAATLAVEIAEVAVPAQRNDVD